MSMTGTKNSNVNQEVERLLAPLKEKEIVQYHIIQDLLDEVYKDPTLGTESTSKEIENKLYKMVDDHLRFANKNLNEGDNKVD
jgi:hypothetical protein